jgi:UDP-hydrolysing UDP-N-acetyl-D-glucosamine 2-epimerase
MAVVLTTRGNYAKMKSTLRAIRAHADLELAIIVGGGIVQDRYRDYRPAIVRDGFTVDATADFLIGDGATLGAQMASAGRATEMIGKALVDVRADVAILIADRWETLSAALAAVCLNVPIAHLEGGEVSGSIDERIRHAVSKLAHLHLPANGEAAERIVRMGEAPERVVTVGTPSLDLLAEIDPTKRSLLAAAPGGEGDQIDFAQDYVVVSQHPVVTEALDAERQILETGAGAATAGLPIVWLLPNMDAGGDGTMRAIANMRRNGLGVPVRFYPSMDFENYAILLANTRCLVGNSSSGVREGAFLGTPAVNIGSRQHGRARGLNVIDTPPERGAIARAVASQIAHGPYPHDSIYGDGHAGEKIAAALAAMPLGLEKTITY